MQIVRLFLVFLLFSSLTGFLPPLPPQRPVIDNDEVEPGSAPHSKRTTGDQTPAALSRYQINGTAQGTTYHITYYARSARISRTAIDSLLNAIDSSLSLYKPYSLISRFNQSDRGVPMDHHLKAVIKKSFEIANRTRGVFDITVQPLVAAWGFGIKKQTALPTPGQIGSLLRCVGSDQLQIKKDSLVKLNPCVRIDVNGIAQGYTADILARFLEQKGVRHYLAEIGGEIRLRGRKQPGNEKMVLGIEAPSEDPLAPEVIQRKIVPPYGAVTTSGNYRKYYESGNGKISHLIDPSTGYPFSNELISVTVWAKDGITADGYDNALMGMGLEKALGFVRKHRQLEAYFIYHRVDGTIADTASKGFRNIMLN